MLPMTLNDNGTGFVYNTPENTSLMARDSDFRRMYVEDGSVFDPKTGKLLGFNRNHPNRGERCVTVNQGTRDDGTPRRVSLPVRELERRGVRHPVFNAATSLRKEQWIMLDQVIVRAARYRLRAWADLAAACPYGGFNGMMKTILEHEVMTDPGSAQVDMDALSVGATNDAPKFQLRGMPLPICHSSFFFDARTLGISQSGGGTPLDTAMAEAAGRRVAETIEKTTIGNQTGVVYGGSSGVGGYDITSAVYGYLNYPNRLTKTNAYLPTGVGRATTGWTALDTVKDVLAALDQLKLNKFYGPFMIYTSNDWDQYLDGDYILSATGATVATQTLRNRLRQIEGVSDVRRLDMLFASTPSSSTGPGGENLNNTYNFTMIFVQLTPEVVQAVNGMDITTLQWEERGGLMQMFKILTISWPRMKSDAYGNCGVLQMHATL